MAKKQAAFEFVGITGTLSITHSSPAVYHEGTLIGQDEESITLLIRKPRSSKRTAQTFSRTDVLYASIGEVGAEDGSYLYVPGISNVDFGDVTVDQVADGVFLGSIEGGQVYAAKGTWQFYPTVEEAEVEEKPAKPAKTAGKKPAAKAEEEAEAEAEGDDEAYTPEEGDEVVVTNTSDESEITGTFEAVNAKKFKITDEDGDEHTFLYSKVTIAAAEVEEKPAKPAKTAGKKPAAKADAKPAGKKAAPAAEDDADEWEK